MHNVHITLQELQGVALMLHRMVFHLSAKVVALPLNISTTNAYLCNNDGTISPFLSRLSCCILDLANKHGITLIKAYIPTHLNVEGSYLSQGRMIPEWHLLPHVTQVAFELWNQLEMDLLVLSYTSQCQHYYT